ncbi:hypothetical protein [Brevundimonas sp. NIBR11]|uniref:hypothetical protein n=1 Tax=Brevundimonas sp. NIBR11 TaxID=3015999 RepID=UPI0022F05D2A|nr:hypothetical protein [Brevundimonas sp. NIBR11]WGM29815.1 hypothetical protein KKHFBJBL_00017 [Brevundimonas sp. NIBR11]
MKIPALLLIASALSCAACAPVVQGGPPLGLPPGLAETASVGTVYVSTGWVNADEDFASTFAEEVDEEMQSCAYGTYPLDLRIHVDEVRRAGRLQTALTGEGEHEIRAVAELVDPRRDNEIMGRYPLIVRADAGGRLAGVLGDRQMIASEAFGRALCDAAFARNPRRPGPHNATAG